MLSTFHGFQDIVLQQLHDYKAQYYTLKSAVRQLGFSMFGPMKCFSFFGGDKKDEQKTTKSMSVLSSISSFTDRELKKSGSELNSLNVSDASAESIGRSSYPSLPQGPSNLRVFIIQDLKAATKNFSHSLMIGEGGFGCVYKGVIKSLEDPTRKIDVAVKQLGRRGTQVKFLFFLHSFSFLVGIIMGYLLY